MAYNFTIQENRDFIKCEISGERNKKTEVEDIATVWSQVAAICKKKEITNVLAILSLEGRPSVLGSFEIVQKAKEFGWNRQLQLALVDTNTDSRKDNLFTKTVALNRGYSINVFENEESALKWLIDV